MLKGRSSSGMQTKGSQEIELDEQDRELKVMTCVPSNIEMAR